MPPLSPAAAADYSSEHRTHSGCGCAESVAELECVHGSEYPAGQGSFEK